MLKRTGFSLVVGLIVLVGVSQAEVLVNENFSGTYQTPFDTTGWTAWGVDAVWTDAQLPEHATYSPNFTYWRNSTVGHWATGEPTGGENDPPRLKATALVTNQVFNGTDIEITFLTTTGTYEGIAVIFNYQDKGNYYMFGVKPLIEEVNSAEANSARFIKVVNYEATTIATFDNPEWGNYGVFASSETNGIEFSVAVDGSDFTFTLSRDDQPTVTFNASDTTYTSGGAAGFFLNSRLSNTAADHFTVESIPEPGTMLLLAAGSLGLLRRRTR